MKVLSLLIFLVDFKHIFPCINLPISAAVVYVSFRKLLETRDAQYNHKGYDFFKSILKSIHSF